MAETQGSAQTKAKNKYNAKAYDSLRIVVKKGRKDIIKAHAEQQGESINGFVNRAIDEAMERDTIGISESTADDVEAVSVARQEYANAETVHHNAINWD